MGSALPEVSLPDPYTLVVEDPPFTQVGSPPEARQRECAVCHHTQVVRHGMSVPRRQHWCDRKSGRHFVTWEAV